MQLLRVTSGSSAAALRPCIGRRARHLRLFQQLAQSRCFLRTVGQLSSQKPRQSVDPWKIWRRSFSEDSWKEEAAQGGGALRDQGAEGGNAVVLSKRLPQDFVENTLLPHLESQLLHNIHTYTPAELTKITRAYAQQPVTQSALCNKLADMVKYRIVAFEAVDIVDILAALYQLCKSDEDLWQVMEEQILHKVNEFTALNLIAIVRVYNKFRDNHADLLRQLVPRLRTLLRDYEALELSEMLLSMSQATEAARDMDILLVLVPEIIAKYREISLVQAINNLWALAQLKIIHPQMIELVAQDLNHPAKSKGLTPRYLSRSIWAFRRCNAFDKVRDSLVPRIQEAVAEFSVADFARLAQCISEEREILGDMIDVLRPGIPEMGRRDLMLFFSGCCHAGAFGDDDDGEVPGTLLTECMTYLREEQDNFKKAEVEQIVFLLAYSDRYQRLLDVLPKSWATVKESCLDFVVAQGTRLKVGPHH